MTSSIKYIFVTIITLLFFACFWYYYTHEKINKKDYENQPASVGYGLITERADISEAMLDKDTQSIDVQLQGLDIDAYNAEQSVLGVQNI